MVAFSSLEGFSQSGKALYYFATNKDTVYCKSLEYGTNMVGNLRMLVYTDANGKKVEIKDKKLIPDVMSFNMNGVFYDKIPLKADKPDGAIRYTKREVDGKLKVYLAQQGTTIGSDFTSDPSGTYRFFLKMPTGTYYKINNKSNMKEHIKPYLSRCKEFAAEYKGDFNTNEEPFMEMIRLYNSLCK